jgi:hypothetical protein
VRAGQTVLGAAVPGHAVRPALVCAAVSGRTNTAGARACLAVGPLCVCVRMSARTPPAS